MNLKQYVLEELGKATGIAQGSFWRNIKTPADVEKQVKYTENMISSYESSPHPGYLDDVEVRRLELQKTHTAIMKAAQSIPDVSIITNIFSGLTQEQFDDWIKRYNNLCERCGRLDNKLINRSDEI